MTARVLHAYLTKNQPYACPACGQRQVATGREVAMFCTNGGRHRFTQMKPVADATARP